jgi:hypothetical protein
MSSEMPKLQKNLKKSLRKKKAILRKVQSQE